MDELLVVLDNCKGVWTTTCIKVGVCRALGVPTTEHTYEDGDIISHVVSLGLQPSSVLVNTHLLFRKSKYVEQI